VPVPNLPELLVGGLAVWRVSALISYERGPFAVFQRIRSAAGIDHFDDGRPDTDNVRGEVGKLLACTWCLSPWIGLVWFIAFGLSASATMAVSAVLGLSSLAIIVERHNHG